LSGEVSIEGHALTARDGIGIYDTDKITVAAKSDGAEVLLMEVPMEF